MSFIFDAKNAGLRRVEAGVYEVYPASYEIDRSSTGKDMVVMNYRLRSDVQQPAAGAAIKFDNFVVGEKSQWHFNQLTKATELFPDRYDFQTLANWAESMLGKPIRVTVEMEKRNNGREYPRVDGIEPSQAKPMREQPKIKSKAQFNQAAANMNQLGNANSPYGPQQPPMSDPSQPATPWAPNPTSTGAPAQPAANTNQPAPNDGGQNFDISDDDLPF